MDFPKLFAAVGIALLCLVAAPVANAAPATELWSTKPLRGVIIPQDRSDEVNNPIDLFVFSTLSKNHLAPANPAPATALLRRAYFDLTGLPPSPEVSQAFARDHRPEAFAEEVDRLLASPAYGERGARHWLDVVRYADTGGFEADLLYENAWRYRDYVVRSLNDDKPFDRFLMEQVAGDELWPDDPDAVTATGLYSIGPVLQESAMVSNQLEYEWLTDAADTTGAAFLGLTLGCARCHNHKYDPITQKDYYAMQAFFAASDRIYPGKVREQRLKALNGLLAEKPVPPEYENDPRCKIKVEDKSGLRMVHLDQPFDVHLLSRGELSKPREVIEPAFPAALTTPQRQFVASAVPATQRRAALARWLASPDINPLPARVIVNRVWAWHFGRGIVGTENDFGTQGDRPSHPELLEWLTEDFVVHGWSLKHLHRLIMTSKTYQMASIGTPEAVQQDPEDRLLSHFPRRRLEAENIWDDLHSCAGTLNLKRFGPPVVPSLTKDELTGLFLSGDKWKVSKDPTEHTRRGIYLFVRRTFLFPMFDAFDPPDVMTSCPRRLETTVPGQSLALLNSKAAIEQAHAFAERLLHDCGPQPEPLLQRAWLLAYSRPIGKPELERALGFLEEREAAVRSKQVGSAGATSPLSEALSELCLALFNTNEFIYLD